MRNLLLLALLPILTGCATRVPGSGAMWHDPPRREWPLPPGPRIDWSRGLSLHTLLDAVEGSPDVQWHLYELEIEGKRVRAAAEMIPECGTELTGARETRSQRTAIGGEIRQVIDVGKRAKWRKLMAEQGMVESAAAAREVLRVALIGAERAYWRAVAAEERVNVRRRAAATLAWVVSDPRGSVDLLAADREATRRELEHLAGGFAPPDWRLTDPFPSDRRRADFARARDLALASRPCMAAGASALASARAQVLLAESASSTDVGFGVGYQVERDADYLTGTGFHVLERKIFGGVSFTIPGHPPDRLAEAERAHRRSLRTLSRARAEILIQVEEAFRRHDGARSHLIDLERDGASRSLRHVDALAEWVDARCELEGFVGRPFAEFAR